MSSSGEPVQPRVPRLLLLGCLPVPIVVAMVGFIFAGPGRLSIGSLVGYTPAILELVSVCEPAQARLGSPLEFSLFGGGLGGNYKSGREAGEGFAYGRLEVQGPSVWARLHPPAPPARP